MFRVYRRYSSGIIEGPLELLKDADLTKPMVSVQPLQPDGPEQDWAQWFVDFEQEMERRRAPITQWVEALNWMSTSTVRDNIQQIRARLLQEKIPENAMYAAVRDKMLDSNPGKYLPMSYLRQI